MSQRLRIAGVCPRDGLEQAAAGGAGIGGKLHGDVTEELAALHPLPGGLGGGQVR